jgi:UDP-N-acetylglucosamine--N-acetylmuramyl-(pentapeptide) pyrophosphoryl-undecaprenol N-acetylglucosamine transferase
MKDIQQDFHILLSGGGTGGHVFPLIAIVRSMRQYTSDKGMGEPKIIFVGPDHFSHSAFQNEHIDTKTLFAPKIRRYFSFANFFDICKIPIALFQSLWHVYWAMPDVIIAKGGYGSVFPVLAAWLYRIPVVIHESDAIAGLGNSIISRFASRIFLSFPLSDESRQKFAEKAEVLGNPIRSALLAGSQDEAKGLFRITSGKPVVLVLGGSQGAQAINELVLQSLGDLLGEYEIIHQIGSTQFEVIKEVALRNTPNELHSFYHPVDFLDETSLAHAYALADFIVSRAGSGSIFEIAALGKPSILIPLQNSAQDHQKKNAYSYADTGAALVMEQQNLTPHLFTQTLSMLANDQAKREAMEKSALAFARPNAADDIALRIIQFLRNDD